MPNLCFCQVSLFPFWRRIFWSSGNELQTLFPFCTLVASKQSAFLKKFIEVWCQRIANLVCTVCMAIKRSVSIWKQADGCIFPPLASGWQLVDTIHCKKNNTNKITSFTFRLLWNRQNMQYADERRARLNDACEGCTAETSFWNAWPWDGIWMFYFSLLRLWYLWIFSWIKWKSRSCGLPLKHKMKWSFLHEMKLSKIVFNYHLFLSIHLHPYLSISKKRWLPME